MITLHIGAIAQKVEHYGEGVGPIFLNRVECNSQEDSLFNCSHEPATQCTHEEDVGVECREL